MLDNAALKDLLVNYLNLRDAGVTAIDYSFLASEEARRDLKEALNVAQINVIFIQPRVMPDLEARPEAREFLENSGHRREKARSARR